MKTSRTLSFLLVLALVALPAFAGVLTAPTISAIGDQVTQKNLAKGPIAFTVGDTDTNLDSLTLSATSSNGALIATDSIAFGGAGAERTVTLKPSLNLTGLSTIVITVSDGAESASDTFQIKVNDPPRLDFNTPLTVNEGATATFTALQIHALDTDGPDTQITYIINNAAEGTATTNGVMRLNGAPIGTNDTFTQDDINNARVTYAHNGSETTNDMFTFGVADGDGGIASDAGHTSFSFHISITPVNDAPVARDSAYAVSLGVAVHGQLLAADPDSPSLKFSITANGTLGSAVVTDSAAGTFTYTPNSGASGIDSIHFQVSDGALLSAVAGKVLFVITNQPPIVTNTSGILHENGALSDTFRASDADLPPQTLTFSIVTNGTKGTAVLTDAHTGAFTYTAAPGSMGSDTLYFKANDGTFDSPEGMYAVFIRPTLETGDIVAAENENGAIIVVDPVTGAQGVLASGDSLSRPRDLVIEPDGNLVVLTQSSGLVRVDAWTGAQTPLTSGASFTTGPLGPTGAAIEPNGSILVADGTAGLKRIDPTTGAVTVLSSGGNLHLAVSVTVASNGDIYLGDASAFGGGSSRVMKIDPVTGNQTDVSVGGHIALPIGITIGDSGKIFVTDATSFAGAPQDYLYSIDPSTGVQTVIPTSDSLHLPTGLDTDGDGKLIVANNSSKKIFRIDPANGAVAVVSAGGLFKQPFGITIVRPMPKLTASRSAFDFGAVAVGSSATDSLIVSNPGDAPLYIVSVASDSVQYQVTPSSATIAPSASQTFHLTFSPTSSDTVFSTVRFAHNAGAPLLIGVAGSGIVTGVKEAPSGIPGSFALRANYPNPFNPTTTMQFDLPVRSAVTMKVYSVIGTEVATIVNRREYEPGSYRERFDAAGLSSGVYFYVITADPLDRAAASFRSVRKMMVLK
jgi:streptogramin lyase